MTIALSPEVEALVQKQVNAGVCGDAAVLVNNLLRELLENQQHRPFEVTPELEAWLLAAADAPTQPLQHSDFTGIRERVRAKFGSQSA